MGGYRGCINSTPPTLHLLLFSSGGKEGLRDTSSHEKPLAESPLRARHQARRLNVYLNIAERLDTSSSGTRHSTKAGLVVQSQPVRTQRPVLEADTSSLWPRPTHRHVASTEILSLEGVPKPRHLTLRSHSYLSTSQSLSQSILSSARRNSSSETHT